ncbi:sentrin-specific protease 1-like [Anopheles coustani]|uniref:sentrin-specific protease 1-like n=1 Tax=Anopheles coustani TaxID=139045 RepID=UPI002659A9E2|nr:sentrin-specific protease 1-like [Anopheles coustani]
MFPGTIISRLRQFLTGGGGEGKDRPAEEAGHYRSMASGVKQNGAHPYASSTAMATSSGSNVRRLSELTDISQLSNAYGINETTGSFSLPRADPVRQQASSSRPMAKRSNNGPPMLIPIKTTTSSAGSSVESEYLRYTQSLLGQQNGDVPTLRPLGGQGSRVANTVPELTNDFRNLLRTKYSITPRRTPDQSSSNYLSELDREINIQREARRKYEELMKKFVVVNNDPLASGNLNRRSLNGNIQRPSMRKTVSIETIELTDDEDDDDIDDEEGRGAENNKVGQLFTTVDALQLTSMDERSGQESQQSPTKMVNSIKEKFEAKPVFRDNIIQDVQKRYGSLFTSRKSLIEQEKERLSRFSKHTSEQEGQMRNKMLNYVCNFYKFEVLDEVEIEEAAKAPKEVPLPALTQAQVDLIHRKVRSGNEVVADKFNLKIRGNDLVTLQGSNWLNDEVINFYMELLRERSELKADQGLPKLYTMNTFFIPRLLQAGHSGVRRWTRKVDLLAYDMIVAPVHVNGIHWCMSIIDLRQKTIHYYDSMGSPNNAVLNALENYLREESLDKRKAPFDTSGFTKENIRDCPRQENGSDCGVFSCMFAEFLSREHPITFDQSKMQYFRQKMTVEIVAGQLLT